MAERTCSIEGCAATRHGRLYCSKHYQRIRHHGHPGPFRAPKPTRCAIPECAEPHKTREWCGKHYQRWLKTGDPLGGAPSPRPGALCSVDGCTRAHLARDYCKLHYRRWQTHGDPCALPEPSYWLDVPEGTKRCRKCRQIKPHDDFYQWKRYAEGRASWCKACWLTYRQQWDAQRNDDQRRRRAEYAQRQKARANFGLTFEEYDELFADPLCRVCRQPNTQRGRRLHIDHDHRTGKVRGLLCHSCNVALGLAGDDPARLRALADYLEAHAT